MTRGIPARRIVLLLTVATWGAGCGDIHSPVPQPVEILGHVTFGGRPLVKGNVAFFPAEGNAGIENFSSLGPGGQFRARLVPGEYRVAIEPDWVRTAGRVSTTNIPKRFWNPELSGLMVTVAKDSPELQFNLK